MMACSNELLLECRLARRQARAASSDRWLDERRLASWVAKAMLAVRRRVPSVHLFRLGDGFCGRNYGSVDVQVAQKLHHADAIDRCPAGRGIELAEIGLLFSPLEQSKRRGRGF